MTCEARKGLNVRPMPEELRLQLRALAKANGVPLYAYVLGLLWAHVQQHRPAPGEARRAPWPTSA